MIHSFKRLIFGRLPFFQPLIQPYSSTKMLSYFCTAKHNPIIEQLFSVDIKELQTSLIEMYKLNETNKRLGITIIMQRIKDDDFPHYVLVNQKFQLHLKQFPDLHVEAMLFRIESQLNQLEKIIKANSQEGKKIAVKDINTCFTIIFQTLKKVPKNLVPQLQIRVYRQFASYHQKYLMRLIQHKRYKQILKKSLDFYKAALNKITIFMQKEEAKAAAQKTPLKLDQLVDDKINELSEEKLQQIQNSIEFKRLRYTQQYSQILYEVMAVQNYITDQRIKQTPRPRSKLKIPFIYHKGLFDLIPLFQAALRLLDKGTKQSSKYYYKIKKTYIQLVYHKNLQEDGQGEDSFQKQTQKFNLKMDQFVEEIIQHLKILPAQEQSIQLCQQMTLVLLGIKSGRVSLLNPDQKTFQKLLVKQIQNILSLISSQDVKKLILANFKVAISASMNINIQKYFRKSPRPIMYRDRHKERLQNKQSELDKKQQ